MIYGISCQNLPVYNDEAQSNAIRKKKETPKFIKKEIHATVLIIRLSKYTYPSDMVFCFFLYLDAEKENIL